MPRYVVTLTDEEKQELKTLVQKVGTAIVYDMRKSF